MLTSIGFRHEEDSLLLLERTYRKGLVCGGAVLEIFPSRNPGKRKSRSSTAEKQPPPPRPLPLYLGTDLGASQRSRPPTSLKAFEKGNDAAGRGPVAQGL